LEPAIAAGHEPGTALIVLPDIFNTAHHERIVALAIQYRVPAIYAFRYFAASGGLMCYRVDTVAEFRRAAAYVDRILKGTKPGELPVQAPIGAQQKVHLAFVVARPGQPGQKHGPTIPLANTYGSPSHFGH
jgi:putative tryptophan/tyrosine transport system substrate-binding protein